MLRHPSPVGVFVLCGHLADGLLGKDRCDAAYRPDGAHMSGCGQTDPVSHACRVVLT